MSTLWLIRGRFDLWTFWMCYELLPFPVQKTRFSEEKHQQVKTIRSFAPILRFNTETATFKVTNTLINDLLTPQIVKSNCEFDGNTSFWTCIAFSVQTMISTLHKGDPWSITFWLSALYSLSSPIYCLTAVTPSQAFICRCTLYTPGCKTKLP